MNKKKRFFSLNIQLALAVMLGIILAAVMYLVCSGLGGYVITERFLSDKAVAENVGAAYENFEAYIDTGHVKGTDNDKISKWLKDNSYTYLLIYDNYDTYFEAGWSEEPKNANPDKAKGSGINAYNDEVSRIDRTKFQQDTKNRIVEFEDGEYYVFIDTYEEQAWEHVWNIFTIFACFITLLATILIYNATVMKRIKEFSAEVQDIADGDLEGKIRAIHNDEIGMLADNVDNMRNSIIQKHKNERVAWEANRELVTAMSHDIRSPLTSIIGYLDIIEDKKYENEDEMDKYVDACRDKAFQLKELSDKLFQYFLVFGNKESDLTLEKLDASLLFQQILGEHSAEIMGYGYKVAMDYTLDTGTVIVDISSIRRLFDNIFSNIMKYANHTQPVEIQVTDEGKTMLIKVSNEISKIAKKVESTKIGLKTCERICTQMKGEFIYSEEDDKFTATVSFPLHKEDEEEISEE